jgi:hypothetical protein
MGKEKLQFLKLKVDISREEEGLIFLLDTGTDVSLLKGSKLIGTAEFNPEDRVRVKCADGSPIETHGAIEYKIGLGSKLITHSFQLASRWTSRVMGFWAAIFFSAPELKSDTVWGTVWKTRERS